MKIKEHSPLILFLLLEQEKGRSGEDAGMNILSIYKSRGDCETVIKAHKKNGQSKWGFKIPENHDFVIQEVPREISFDLAMPSWADEMNNLTKALEEMMSDMDISESTDEGEVSEE